MYSLHAAAPAQELFQAEPGRALIHTRMLLLSQTLPRVQPPLTSCLIWKEGPPASLLLLFLRTGQYAAVLNANLHYNFSGLRLMRQILNTWSEK